MVDEWWHGLNTSEILWCVHVHVYVAIEILKSAFVRIDCIIIISIYGHSVSTNFLYFPCGYVTFCFLYHI